MKDEFGIKDFQILQVQEILTVVDNRCKEIQRIGIHKVSHNTLAICDLKQVFTSLNNAENTPHGYRNRLVFSVGLVTGLRPKALASLELRPVSYTHLTLPTTSRV